MRAGIAFLIVAYTLSQFYRAFLAVLAPALEADLGATTEDLARASGLWFAAFALMQLPVGWALDTLGPRRTASVLFLGGGAGGAALFAMAQGPGAITGAMILIGIGCAPVLMSTYFIFARTLPAAIFGTLAGLTVGVSSLGNILSAAPMAMGGGGLRLARNGGGLRSIDGACRAGHRGPCPRPAQAARGAARIAVRPAEDARALADPDRDVRLLRAGGWRARPLDQPLRGRGAWRGAGADRDRDAGHGAGDGDGKFRLRTDRPVGGIAQGADHGGQPRGRGPASVSCGCSRPRASPGPS